MELRLVKGLTIASSTEVETIHDGNKITWTLMSQVMQEGFDTFDHINRYWASLPHETQSAIFNVYERIHQAFKDLWEQEPLAKALRPLIAELFYLHPQESVQLWVSLKSDVLIPPSIKSKFDISSGMSGTPERTYLTDDYKKLVPLAITMRIMIPIWGEFIARSKKELGTIFKEYQAFQLLSSSSIIKCEAMCRLQTFVEHTISKDHSLDAAIITGISTEDFPTWTMAVTVVRRLCYADVRGLDQKGSSLVSYLYNFIDQKVSTLDSQIGTIKFKHTVESSGDGENNLSRLEGFKIKQAVPTGDIAVVSFYIQSAVRYALSSKKVQSGLEQNNLISRLCPDPDFPQIVKQVFSVSNQLMKERLTNPQVAIAGWVLSQWIPIRSIPYLQKTDVVAMILLSQAYLWKKGYKQLAILQTASARPKTSQDSHVVGDSKQRMPRATSDEINEAFPYLRRTNSRAKNVKMLSATLSAIDEITEALDRYQWIPLTMPARIARGEFDELAAFNEEAAQFRIPPDIREQLGRLIIEINNRLGQSIESQSQPLPTI